VTSLGAALPRMAERSIPRLPAGLDPIVSVAAGTAAYRLAGAARDAVRRNLAVVAPDRPDRERLVRATFIEQVRHYLEIFRLARMDPAALERAIAVSGWDTMANAHARGKGVVLASAHIGPVSVCGQILVLRGLKVTLPVETETSELARAVNRARRSMGLQLVPIDSPFGIHRALRRGEVVGILSDRAVTGIGERVPFFGREALLPSAHVALALRTGAALVPGFAHHDGNTLRATFEPELELPRSGDRHADVREGVRRWARVLEKHIRSAPEQWSVFEPVWA
jgi:phosphatidylinositol dimannoside acyltransferase